MCDSYWNTWCGDYYYNYTWIWVCAVVFFIIAILLAICGTIARRRRMARRQFVLFHFLKRNSVCYRFILTISYAKQW